MLPIIYVRYGDLKKHTFVSLSKTLERNKKIYFLGDVDPQIAGVEFHDISKYQDGVSSFKDSYLHLSTNKYQFEFYCIARWFALRNFVLDVNIDQFYYCDDDVFNFCEIDEVYKLYKKYEASFLFSENLELASACCSFWETSAIEAFCEFVMSEYNHNLTRYLTIWNAVSARHERGGVSDMTLLYFFSLGKNIGSLTKLTDDGCFDMNPLISQNEVLDEYEMERPYLLRAKIKKMRYDQGNAFAFSKQRSAPVRVFAAPEHAKFEVIKKERNILRRGINKIFRLGELSLNS